MPDTGLQNLPSFSPGAGARRHGAGTSRVRKGTQSARPQSSLFCENTHTLSLSLQPSRVSGAAAGRAPVTSFRPGLPACAVTTFTLWLLARIFSKLVLVTARRNSGAPLPHHSSHSARHHALTLSLPSLLFTLTHNNIRKLRDIMKQAWSMSSLIIGDGVI